MGLPADRFQRQKCRCEALKRLKRSPTGVRQRLLPAGDSTSGIFAEAIEPRRLTGVCRTVESPHRMRVTPCVGAVAQLVRAPDCRSGGYGFEPRRPRFCSAFLGMPSGTAVSRWFSPDRENRSAATSVVADDRDFASILPASQDVTAKTRMTPARVRLQGLVGRSEPEASASARLPPPGFRTSPGEHAGKSTGLIVRCFSEAENAGPPSQRRSDHPRSVAIVIGEQPPAAMARLKVELQRADFFSLTVSIATVLILLARSPSHPVERVRS